MQYIISSYDGVTYFDPYFEYLESIRESLPPALESFACDRDRYDLSNHKSLHDAWLIEASVMLGPNAVLEGGQSMVKIQLLGPYHDRIHHLQYLAVSNFDLAGMSGPS